MLMVSCLVLLDVSGPLSTIHFLEIASTFLLPEVLVEFRYCEMYNVYSQKISAKASNALDCTVILSEVTAHDLVKVAIFHPMYKVTASHYFKIKYKVTKCSSNSVY